MEVFRREGMPCWVFPLDGAGVNVLAQNLCHLRWWSLYSGGVRAPANNTGTIIHSVDRHYYIYTPYTYVLYYAGESHLCEAVPFRRHYGHYRQATDTLLNRCTCSINSDTTVRISPSHRSRRR